MDQSLDGLISRRDFLLGVTVTAGTLVVMPTFTLAADTEYKWVVGEKEVAEMAAKFLGQDPRKVADIFGEITPGKINPAAERSLHTIWPGDQVVFNLNKVPADQRESVEAKLREYDALHGQNNDGTFSLPGVDYDKAVVDMTHGLLNAEGLQKGFRVLTLYRVEQENQSVDGVVRRFEKGGTPEDDEVGHADGAIYKAVRAEDVAKAMKELEGNYVFGLGKLSDFHPDVFKEFAAYIKTAKVGLKDPREEHFKVSPEGRLHRLEDKATWRYADQPVPAERGAPSPVFRGPERALLGQVYDTLVWGPGFQTPGTCEGQLGTPIYKPKK